MRHVFVLLLLAPLAGDVGASAASASECRETVTAQIHDYEHLPGGWLADASEIVTRIYERIGVRIEWLGPLRQQTHPVRTVAEPARPRARIAQLTIIILTPKMAARGHVAEGVLGYAAVPDDGRMGRIAYVIFDRVRQVTKSQEGGVELLGFVIAHEMGHLLLGPGWGSDAGFMQSHWDRRRMQALEPLTLGFSATEGERIRNMIRNDSAPAVAVATSGSQEADVCEAVPTDASRTTGSAVD
jgi:hypothetical protein